MKIEFALRQINFEEETSSGQKEQKTVLLFDPMAQRPNWTFAHSGKIVPASSQDPSSLWGWVNRMLQLECSGANYYKIDQLSAGYTLFAAESQRLANALNIPEEKLVDSIRHGSQATPFFYEIADRIEEYLTHGLPEGYSTVSRLNQLGYSSGICHRFLKDIIDDRKNDQPEDLGLDSLVLNFKQDPIIRCMKSIRLDAKFEYNDDEIVPETFCSENGYIVERAPFFISKKASEIALSNRASITDFNEASITDFAQELFRYEENYALLIPQSRDFKHIRDCLNEVKECGKLNFKYRDPNTYAMTPHEQEVNRYSSNFDYYNRRSNLNDTRVGGYGQVELQFTNTPESLAAFRAMESKAVGMAVNLGAAQKNEPAATKPDDPSRL